MSSRIYVVIEKGSKPTQRLVEATSAAQAIRHCARNVYEAKAAMAKDVAGLMSTGITIEKATESVSEQPITTN